MVMKKMPNLSLLTFGTIKSCKKAIDNKCTFMKKIVLLILSIGFFSFSCEDQDLHSDCLHGKYIGDYCEGAVIQILDDHKIGRDWNNPFTTFGPETYTNSVVASIDTLIAKEIDPDFFSPGVEFYFKYRDGGYVRKQFSNCEPSAFITITFISENPCLK